MIHIDHRRNIGFLLVISFFFLMFGNNLVSLTHPDEVFYSQTAKEMLAHDSWLTPYIFDEIQFEKPFLFFWLLAVLFKFFGITPFIARFWPAFFGMGGVVITYWLAHMLFKDRKAAFLSGFVLSTSFIYLALSRAVLTDMVFSVLVILSIALFYFAYKNQQHKTMGICGAFAVSALAVLTKGVLGFIFPVGVFVLFLLYKRDMGFLRCAASLWGVALFLLMAAPWHILMFKLYGQEFIQEYWHNVHLRRIVEAEHQKSNTWYFYLITMFVGSFPWSFFLVPAVYFAWRRIRQNTAERDGFVFLGILVLFIWGGMQIAASKLASYIFPVFPGLAIMTGHYFSRVPTDPPHARSMRVASYIFGALLLSGVGVGIYFGHKYIDYVGDISYVYLIFGLLGVCGALLLWFTRRRKPMAAVTVVSALTVVVLCFALLGRQYAEPWVSCQDVSQKFMEIDGSDSTVLCAKFYVRAVRFYTDRDVAVIDINGSGFFSPHPIPFLNTYGEVDNFLKSQTVTYGILKKSNVKDLQKITQGRYDMDVLFEEGGKYIVRVGPLPEK